MVKIIREKDDFKLPYLSREDFLRIVRSGVGYDSGRRIFFVKDNTAYDAIKNLLSEVLGDEVNFLQVCAACGEMFPCKDQKVECNSRETCTTMGLPIDCICYSCRQDPDVFDKMMKRSERLLRIKS